MFVREKYAKYFPIAGREIGGKSHFVLNQNKYINPEAEREVIMLSACSGRDWWATACFGVRKQHEWQATCVEKLDYGNLPVRFTVG